MRQGTYIKPRGTIIDGAISLNKRIESPVYKAFYYIVLGLALCSLPAIFLAERFGLGREVGFAYIIIGSFALIAAQTQFAKRIKSSPSVSLVQIKEAIASNQPANLFSVFSYDLAKATRRLFASKEIDTITTKELIIALADDQELFFVLNRLGLAADYLKEIAEAHEADSKVLPLILSAFENSIMRNQSFLSGGAILLSLCAEDDIFKRLLEGLGLELHDVENVVYWYEQIGERIKSEEGISSRFRMTGGIGHDWAFGYTPFLKQYSIDITQSIKNYGLGLELIGRENEIDQIEEALSKSEGGNVVVVGDAGVGKRSVILGFARKVLEGRTNGFLSHMHVFQVDTDALLAGATAPGELADRLTRILNEASYAGNIIIFIENVDNILSAGGVGQADMSEVLLPYLDHGGIHIIGTSEVAGYNNFIAPSGALSQRFIRVSIKEPEADAMIQILEETIPMIEAKNSVYISYEAVKEVIKVTDRHILNQPNPEKSINYLEGVAAKCFAEKGECYVLPQDVQGYLAEKMEIPTGEVSDSERETLLNLETKLHDYVVGQEEGLKAVADALRRSRSQVNDSRKPIGSFLFLGPTGVGKTATAKALANVYFGGEDRMIRFDMSEYQNKEDIYRLIGQQGESERGLLVTAVNEKPFALLLFDEVEKACPDILNLFLQILDEGFVTDSNGQKVSFTDTIIIVTSNAGATVIREAIRSSQDFESQKANLIDYLVDNNIFRPEFINRFTSVIAFSPLNEEQILSIAKSMIGNVQATVLANKDIRVTVEEAAIAYLAKAGFDPEMGARPMERIIQEKIENLLAKKILAGELDRGSEFVITAEMIR